MNEHDTFIKLKSLTKEEAERLSEQVYTDLCIDLECEGVSPLNGVPFNMMKDRVDMVLKPYGWTYDRLYPEFFIPGNFS